jgi:hypothetical protein
MMEEFDKSQESNQLDIVHDVLIDGVVDTIKYQESQTDISQIETTQINPLALAILALVKTNKGMYLKWKVWR